MSALDVFRKFRENGEHIIHNYVTDYDIDLYFMANWEIKNNGTLPRMLHLTRELGTHSSLLYPEHMLPNKHERVKFLFGTVNREEFIDQIGADIAYFSVNKEKEMVIQYYDGEFVKIITMGEALQIIREHKKNLREYDQIEMLYSELKGGNNGEFTK